MSIRKRTIADGEGLVMETATKSDQGFIVVRDEDENPKVGLWTGSNVKRFWLTSFRGYEVVQTRNVPKYTLLGNVAYQKRWLVAPSRGKHRHT